MVKSSNPKKNSKHLLLWFLACALLFSPLFVTWRYKDSTPLMFAYTSRERLVANVIEDCPGTPPAKDIAVRVDGEKLAVSKQGSFVAENLAPGKHHLTITGKRYEAVTEDINIKKGGNKRELKVSLTPTEAASRWVKSKAVGKYTKPNSNKGIDDIKRVDPQASVRLKTDRYFKYPYPKLDLPRPPIPDVPEPASDFDNETTTDSDTVLNTDTTQDK